MSNPDHDERHQLRWRLVSLTIAGLVFWLLAGVWDIVASDDSFGAALRSNVIVALLWTAFMMAWFAWWQPRRERKRRVSSS